MYSTTTLMLGVAGLCSTAFSNPIIAHETVRPSEILKHLESTGYEINWKDLGNNITIAHFDSKNWASWESTTIAKRQHADSHLPGLLPKASSKATKKERASENFTCYGSGSWAKDETLEIYVLTICDDWAPEMTRHLEREYVARIRNERNEAGDAMDIVYTFRNSLDTVSTPVECRRLLYELINNRCQGNNRDTRGGQARIGNNIFGVDPTTHNCNC